MVLRGSDLNHNLQHLSGMLTTHEAAKLLGLSYWHFMHLVEAGRISGVRIVDRWLFSAHDLDTYRRSKYGALEDMAQTALNHPAIGLTEKQTIICESILRNERPSDIARELKQTCQAVHSQISLIHKKVSRTQQTLTPSTSTGENVAALKRATRSKRSSIPLA